MALKLNALKSVGNFAGDTDVERWIERMDLALRIDGIPDDRHADVMALHLEGAAFDTWKGLSVDKKMNVAAIKAELRAVFGLQRMDAWNLAASLVPIAPGDTVDVVFEELKKLVGIAAAGGDTEGRIAACLLISRLPLAIREQVLLQCGTDMEPTAVVKCAKQLMATSSSFNNVYTATTVAGSSLWNKPGSTAKPRKRKDLSTIRCFKCHVIGHIARNCHAKSAVSGNECTGQLQA